MKDFLSQRWVRVLATSVVAAGLYIACDKFPAQAAKLAALATTVAAALPSALSGPASKDEGES